MRRAGWVLCMLCLWGLMVSGCAQKDVNTEGMPDPATSSIAVMVGSTGDKIVDTQFPEADKQPFDSVNDAVLALMSGRVDYVITAYTTCLNYSRENPGELVILPEELYSEPAAIAINKDETELRDDIDRVMKQFQKDGTLDRIIEHWIREDGSDYLQEEIPIGKDGKVLNVAVSAEREPMCFVENGEVVGLDAELIQRIAYELDMRVEFHDMKFSAMIPSVLSGKTPVATSNITATEERKESVNFSVPYYVNPQVFLTRAEAVGAVNDKTVYESFFDSFRRTFIVENRWKLVVSGMGITLLISVFAGVVGIIIGFVFCLMRMSYSRILCVLASTAIRILQGTPIVVLLMILYYIVFNKSGLGGVGVAVIAFGLNFGAYSSEIMRSGILAVDRGQREASYALGFNRIQTFQKIVLPQAARHFLPVLKGEFISLVKMTSVVGYVAVQDLTKVSDIIRSRTYEAFFPLIATAILYFLLSFGLSSLLNLVEVKMKHGGRGNYSHCFLRHFLIK